jgi:hypothetical protein
MSYQAILDIIDLRSTVYLKILIAKNMNINDLSVKFTNILLKIYRVDFRWM